MAEECKVTIKGLCKKTEKYQEACTKMEWAPSGCSYQVKEKYGCNKKAKTVGKCWYKAAGEEAKCVVEKWVKDGCTATVQKPGQCKNWVWDPTCCAETKTVRKCKDKWCPYTICGVKAGAEKAASPIAAY